MKQFKDKSWSEIFQLFRENLNSLNTNVYFAGLMMLFCLSRFISIIGRMFLIVIVFNHKSAQPTSRGVILNLPPVNSLQPNAEYNIHLLCIRINDQAGRK